MLILYSGGLDSTVLLNQYKDKIKLALIFDYGSKNNTKEIYFAEKNCKKLNIPFIKIELDFILNFFKSDILKNGGPVPDGSSDNLNETKKNIVPFRNAILLRIGVGIAESNDIDQVLIANHSDAFELYPDCRPEFIENMNLTSISGTWNNCQIVAPYLNLSKKDIVTIGRDLNVDFKETYTCYEGGEKHCGKCRTCLKRKESLLGNDPTEYYV